MRKSSGMSRALVRRETVAGYLFMLPSLFFFITFVVYPMFMCIFTSLFDSNMGRNSVDVFVGLQNYRELFQDKIFLGALKNTLVIVLVSVPTVCAFSLWVASAITDMKPALTSADIPKAKPWAISGSEKGERTVVKSLRLQPEEVQAVRWATEDEILQMIDDGRFIPYEKSQISLLFFRRNHRSSHTKSDWTGR